MRLMLILRQVAANRLDTTRHDWTLPDRTGPNRTLPDRTGPNPTGLDLMALDRTEPEPIAVARARLTGMLRETAAEEAARILCERHREEYDRLLDEHLTELRRMAGLD